MELLAARTFSYNWFDENPQSRYQQVRSDWFFEIGNQRSALSLYEQDDVVAMGSPVGPLVGNAFLYFAEEMLERENKMPAFYRKYVNDTLATIPNTVTPTTFLLTLNGCQSSVQFTTEIASNNKLPFVGMMIEKKGCHLTTCLCRNQPSLVSSLLRHYQSHVD